MSGLRIGSLCSGAGMLDEAVRSVLGGEVVWHAETDPAASLVLAHRYPGLPNLGDVRTVDWSSQALVDLITAGYPCQPFSQAGQRKGADDDRHLWPHVAEAVRGIRPGLVVLENVAGHRTLGLDAVLGDLAALGYDTRWTSLRAADIGAAHGRERIFILAADARHRGKLDRAWAQGRDGGEWAPVWPQLGRLGDAAPDADRAGQRQRGRGIAGDAQLATAERRGALAADPNSGRCVEPDQGLGGVQFPDVGGLPPWGQYQQAVDRWAAVIGRPAPDPTHELDGLRVLNPRADEWLMGWPDGWVTDVPGITRNDALRICGNGVVPQQAAEALRRLLPFVESENVA